MNRRRFLSWLGTGLTVGAVASVLPLESLLKYSGNKTYFDMGRSSPILATIGEYSDYVNFSDLSLAAAMDESVKNIATQMGYRMGLTLDTLVSRSFSY